MAKYDDKFKLKIMEESTECGNIGAVAKKYKIPASTVHTWFKRSNRKDKIDNARTVKNLKKELSNKDLENKILKELLKKTYLVWDAA